MTFSDSLPVQFWLTGCQTFNEKEVDGINHVCWRQPWNCADEIPVQFQADDDTSPEETYTLSVKDRAGTELASIALTESSDGVFATLFTPEDYEICNAIVRMQILDSTDTEVAKTDILHIKTSHAGTELIEYSNNRNFAGLIYEDASPITSFFLRVPAVFFHPRFPQESRAIERTTSTVVTSSKLKKQRLLQVLHAPAYFHEKIILALSHHNVEIDGKQWKKEEAYEMDDGDPHYPLKKATVYLTEKNFLARNVL